MTKSAQRYRPFSMFISFVLIYQAQDPEEKKQDFPPKQKEAKASLSSVSSVFFSACESPNALVIPQHLRQWDATYQLSPLVKVLLLSSSFFSTASSSTAVCSKSAETESWGEQEASCEDTTFWTAKHPAFLVRTAPTPFPLEARKTHSLYTCVAQAARCAHGTQSCLCEWTWPSTPSYTSLCPRAATGSAYRVPCTCKGKDPDLIGKFIAARWTVARVAKAHTSLTPDYIPQLHEEQMAVSIWPRTRAYL